MAELDELITGDKKVKYVYGLTCPDTGICRYVGISSNVKRRYVQHCLRASNKNNNRRENWLRGLIDSKKKPGIIIIAEPTKDYNDAEIYWITYYREKHPDHNVNTSDGGDDMRYANEALVKMGRPKRDVGSRVLCLISSHVTSLKRRGAPFEEIMRIQQKYDLTRIAVDKIRKDGTMFLLQNRFPYLC